MNIYLAAPFSNQEYMKDVEKVLKNDGHCVVSGWIHEVRKSKQACALQDLQDLQAADMLLSFTGLPALTLGGGRHVEFGLALAAGLHLWLVGPRENIFHYLPQVQQFDNWHEARTALKGALFVQ